MKIPRIMSTQHPDNVQLPFFAESRDMSGDDEIQEAYYAFSHLGCDEQMWDCEGKEVDDFVVRKLLTKYEHFFKANRLGEDVRLTLRLPNPDVEKNEAKVFVETLESIPRSCDAAGLFYGGETPPIHEVILPMTMSAESLNRVYYYYKEFVVGKQNQPFYPGDITIAEWIGEFKPREISVIPLFEDREHMLEAHTIMRAYLKGKNIRHQRVFIARSDPAMNYGMVSAILCNKIALQRLRLLSEDTGVRIYPILGAGSAPFRGHLAPDTVDHVLEEYPDVQTFTVQSAFKYDHPVASVLAAIGKLKSTEMKRGSDIEEGKCLELIDKVSAEYRRVIEHLAPLINYVAPFVPRRRMRKLHVGLFGYARSVGKTTLPRVISFCAACYSLGLPPEIMGLNALSKDDIRRMKDMHVNFPFDMQTAMSYFNEDALTILPDEVKASLKLDWGPYEVNQEHKTVTSRIIKAVKNKDSANLQGMLIEAAHIRKFLG
ncbi:MAG: phosphoenolpyruvate carboxylase [Nitrospirae bacterium RBG_19FT_COMBO_55_12]|nr:MAG: phosphoenolpyruvate carboxylase [Nitrospirae bacterium RBG_19FT_COMBO_55_12]